MATHFSILAWRIPMDRGAWWAIVRCLPPPLPQHRPPREPTATRRRGGAVAHPQRSWHPRYNDSYCQLEHFFQIFWRILRVRGESPRSCSGRSDLAMALGGDLHPHREVSGLRQVHTAAEPPRAPQHSLAEDGLGAETPAPEEEAAETRSGMENPMDRGAWQVTVHRVMKTQT